MTALSAYGLILLAALGSGLIVWVVCWRYWHAKPLPDHTAYILGWDACSRVRDREEAQRRKEQLLSPVVSQDMSSEKTTTFRGVS